MKRERRVPPPPFALSLGSCVLNTRDAAKYVGMGKGTLEKRRIYGGGPVFVKPSTRIVRYLISDLDTRLTRNRAASTSELD